MLCFHDCYSCWLRDLYWLGFYSTAENPGQERLWTRNVSSSTLQQLQSLGRRRRRNQLQAKCRWVWLPGQHVGYQVRNSQAPHVSTALALAGDSGGSDHQCQPPAGGFWQRQDREEWQLLSLCKSLGHYHGHYSLVKIYGMFVNTFSESFSFPLYQGSFLFL